MSPAKDKLASDSSIFVSDIHVSVKKHRESTKPESHKTDEISYSDGMSPAIYTYLCNLPALMVTTNEGYPVWISDLRGERGNDCLV